MGFLGNFGHLSGSEKFNSIDDKIQSASEIVDPIAKDRREVFGEEGDGFDFENIISSISIMLNEDFVIYSCGKNGDHSIEIIDFFRPA